MIDDAVQKSLQSSEQDDEAKSWAEIQSDGKHQSIQAGSSSILGSIMNVQKALQL